MGNSISTLGQALDQISRLKTQQRTMDTLATQLNTGKKTQQFSGLGKDILTSQRARTNIQSLDTYINNIKIAERRVQLMDNSLTHITKQAREVLSSLQLSMEQGDYPSLSAIKDGAGAALDYIMDLINTQDGDRYIFAGADSSVKPINKSNMMASVMGEFEPDGANINNPPVTAVGLVGQWGEGTITTEQFIEAYHNINEGAMGYSASLSSHTAGKVYAHVSDATQIDYTVLANNPGLKEIVTALNVLKSLPPVEHAPGGLNDPNATTLDEDVAPFPPAAKQESFFKVIDDLAKMIGNGLKAAEQESHKMAQVQFRLDMVKTNHTQEVSTLKSIVSDVEDVDPTEVAAKISQLQVQLEASYTVTALVSNLSLVNFLR